MRAGRLKRAGVVAGLRTPAPRRRGRVRSGGSHRASGGRAGWRSTARDAAGLPIARLPAEHGPQPGLAIPPLILPGTRLVSPDSSVSC